MWINWQSKSSGKILLQEGGSWICLFFQAQDRIHEPLPYDFINFLQFFRFHEFISKNREIFRNRKVGVHGFGLELGKRGKSMNPPLAIKYFLMIYFDHFCTFIWYKSRQIRQIVNLLIYLWSDIINLMMIYWSVIDIEKYVKISQI
jgi:hypothetical protein